LITKKIGEDQINELLKRATYLKELREPWQKLWKELAPYVLPRRANFDNTGEEAKTIDNQNNDPTPVIANQTLADGLQGYTVSRTIKWFKILLQDREMMKSPGVADWLELVEHVVYALFNRTNFYDVMSEFFQDGGSIGTPTIYTQDDVSKGSITFTAVHPGEMYIAENDEGKVDTHVRRRWMTGKALLNRFGKENINHTMLETIDKTPFKKHEVYHFCFPLDQRKMMGVEDLTLQFPIASIYIDVANKHCLSISGYYETPFHTWRWRKNSGETYARSPAIDSRSDILTINQIKKTLLMVSQLSAQPPFNVPEDMKGLERIVPNGYNYYSNNQKIEPISLGQNYPIGKDQWNDLVLTINKRFYVDFFLMLQHLEKSMTAREVIERQGEKAAILGTVVGRLNSECLDPLLRRVINIAFRKGWLPPPPPALLRGGGELEFDFLGPLAQIQKSYYQSQGVTKGFSAVAPIIQLKPETLDIFDMDQLVRETAESFGMPQSIIREEPEIKKLRILRAEQQQKMSEEAQRQEMTKEVMKNYSQLNEEPKEGSAIDALNQFITGRYG
jgi:hypothetical protein